MGGVDLAKTECWALDRVHLGDWLRLHTVRVWVLGALCLLRLPCLPRSWQPDGLRAAAAHEALGTFVYGPLAIALLALLINAAGRRGPVLEVSLRGAGQQVAVRELRSTAGTWWLCCQATLLGALALLAYVVGSELHSDLPQWNEDLVGVPVASMMLGVALAVAVVLAIGTYNLIARVTGGLRAELSAADGGWTVLGRCHVPSACLTLLLWQLLPLAGVLLLPPGGPCPPAGAVLTRWLVWTLLAPLAYNAAVRLTGGWRVRLTPGSAEARAHARF